MNGPSPPPADAPALLAAITPFRLLTAAQRAALAAALTEQRFAAGEVLARQGDAEDRRVFLLAEGRVGVFDPECASSTRAERLDVITPGHYFGERAALLEEPRNVELRALTAVRALSMPGERFLALLDESPPFAQAMRDILRDKQKILAAFDEFLAEILAGVARGELHMPTVLTRYRDLVPALHPLLHDPEVDHAALLYAVKRLPENVTRTFAFFLTDNIPVAWTDPAESFTPVRSDVRPRSVYEMLPGKSMVLLRDGLSDLLDFVTCLCVLSIEGRKLRRRLTEPEVLLSLTARRGAAAAPEDELAALGRLGLPPEEARAIARVWPGEAMDRLRDLCLHHEDFAVHVVKSRNNYNSRHSELWATQIAEATRELMGAHPWDLPPDIPVHVISSNTHSVSNCLSAGLLARAETILDWGRSVGSPLLAHAWTHREDLVYALSRRWFAAHPADLAAREEADRAAGILTLRDTAFTGIQVELIDAGRVCRGPIDPGIARSSSPGGAGLIVNIDFAFGQQADEIIGTLLGLFARNLASVNVLGKAGALQGARGDLLVPTAFVEQSRDLLDPLPPSSVDPARLAARVPGRAVHAGPMLTVPGTLLQNRVMLQFYRRLFRCVGLEMEGAFYHRRVVESAELGVVPSTLPLRYLYYVSDLPLLPGANLSESMGAHEGIPPLYGITREILSAVLTQA